MKWILVDRWAHGCLSHTAPSNSCQGSGETGDTGLGLQPHQDLHHRACAPASAPSAQSPGSWLGTTFISSLWQVPGCAAGSRMAPFCRPGCWVRRGCCVRDSVPELSTLHCCWEPGLPSEAVPAAAGVLRAFVCPCTWVVHLEQALQRSCCRYWYFSSNARSLPRCIPSLHLPSLKF